jgi:hypothetical protein
MPAMKHASTPHNATPVAQQMSRHTRLFELIRQKNQADTTVARLNGVSIRKISSAEMLQLQAAAAKSLEARP